MHLRPRKLSFGRSRFLRWLSTDTRRALLRAAGLGTLRLAQALLRRDLDAEVFERDKSSWDRPTEISSAVDSDRFSHMLGQKRSSTQPDWSLFN